MSEEQKRTSISLRWSVGMTEKIVINIVDVPLVDRGNGKQFAVSDMRTRS